MTKRVLITGGAGFIGLNFTRYFYYNFPEYNIINLDKLTYAGNAANLSDLGRSPRYEFIRGDIGDSGVTEAIFGKGIDWVINFAAESHVDRSIENPRPFIDTNIGGTQNLLEMARKYPVRKFIQVSTDEVYGSLGPEGYFSERSLPAPTSPYSASKAGADLLALAYWRTFGVPVIITRSSNNYGPFQYPEKLIPLMITNALEDKPLPLYGDGLNIRDWLHVADHCRALAVVLQRGRIGEIYNIGGHHELTNRRIVETILQYLNKPDSLLTYVADRLGHDRRYAVDTSKIEREVGWRPTVSFETGLTETIRWYVANSAWWQRMKTGTTAEKRLPSQLPLFGPLDLNPGRGEG